MSILNRRYLPLYFEILLVFTLCSLLILQGMASKGVYINWDRVVYTALSLSTEEAKPGLRETAHRILRDEISREDFVLMTRHDKDRFDYRYTCYSNDEAFNEQLGFYHNRVGYIALVRLLTGVGFSFGTAFRALSIVPCLLIILVVSYASRKSVFLAGKYVVPLATFLILTISKMHTMAVPDALCTLLTILYCLSLFVYRRPALGAAACLLAISVRPDSIIVAVVILLGYCWYVKEMGAYLFATAIITCALLLYGAISRAYPSYPLTTLLYNSFVTALPYPLKQEIHVTLKDHLHWMRIHIGAFVGLMVCMAIPAIGFLVAFLKKGEGISRLTLCLLAVCLVVASARYAIYPSAEARNYACCAIIGLLSLIVNDVRHLPNPSP